MNAALNERPLQPQEGGAAGVQQGEVVAQAEAGPGAEVNQATMILTATELARAHDIREAVELDPRVRNLTDFEYVQWALTMNDLPLEAIQEKVYLMQCFREEYNIQDTIEEGVHTMAMYCLRQQPGHFLSFEYLPSSKNYVMVEDIGRFDPKKIQTHDDFRIFLGATFYQFQAASCDFTAMRRGHTCLYECMDAGFHNYEQRVMDKKLHEFFLHYPKQDYEYYFCNTPTVISFFYGLIKPFIPQDRRQAFQLGYQPPGLEGRRLDTVYNVPTPVEARKRMVKKLSEILYQRYQNQDSFSLANCRIRP